MMKSVCIAIVTSVMLLAGCSSGAAYKAADGSRYGYTDRQISGDHYRVSYTARPSQADQAKDFALLRAAELTLLEGYDWFVVLDRDTDIERREQTPAEFGVSRRVTVSRDCGLIGCTTRYEPQRKVAVDASAGSSSRGVAKSVLEIRLGKGVRPDTIDSYDARTLWEDLRQRVTPQA